ncbi:hypothetical protein ACH5RR_024305 [Cinchona calisaya]|uniref:NB-ARC domain-containing protein n=1 Tax=Cinchona calisaya TaxID=153742 RepID=A0ABD2YWB5_9GENT
MVRCHFEAFAWFTVGKQFDFDTRTFYTSLLKQLAPEETKKDIFKCYTTELIWRRIMEVQSSGRCLVVLDDVWLKEFFMCYSRDFPRGFGSKLLVTTQIQQVAERVRSDETYQMRHLNENESFELFVKRAFVSPYPDPELYGMKDIVKRCEGIPLIIDVLGRLLASKHTLYESKALLDATSFCLDISKQCGPEQLEREL